MAPEAPGRESYRVGDLIVDVGLQRVGGPAGDIVLPKLSFDLLLALLRRAPDFVSNDELASLVWPGLVVSPETVTKRVNLLRDALGDDATRSRYIAGLRGRGYRIVAPVSSAVQATIAAEVSEQSGRLSDRPPRPESPDPALVARNTRDRRRYTLALALLCAVAAATWWAVRSTRIEAPVPTPVIVAATDASVAVMPFENLSPSPDDAYLALGVPEMVLDRLSTIPHLTVIATGSTPTAWGPVTDPGQLGRRLGARYLVLGSVQREGSRLRVGSRLVDTQTGTQVWSTRIDRAVADLFVIQDTIAAQVADELRKRVGGIALALRPGKHQPPIDAQLAYLQGRVLLNRYSVRGADQAAGKFAEALAIDPRFAAAAAGVFDARMLAAERRHQDLAVQRALAMPLIQRALEIDPDCSSAYIARAIWGGGDEAAQEGDFRRGLQLDPGNGRGLVAFSEFLDRRGRYDEGALALDRALVVDPLAPRAHFRRVMRQFELTGSGSLESGMKQVLEIDPDYQPALQRYAKYRWMHGQLADAAQIIDHAVEVDPENPWSRHTASAIYLDLGDPETAREIAQATPSSRSTSAILLGLHASDWRVAGETALSAAGSEYNVHESWGVPEAVRDYAMHTREYARAIRFFERRYGLGDDQPALNLGNFRAAAYLAQLLRASGETARASQLLERLSGEIDASIPRFGAVYALRTKATVQLLSGDRHTALRTLADSFDADDLTLWWYTLEHDPLWAPLRSDPVFVSTAAQVRARAARERATLAEAHRIRPGGRPDVTAPDSPR
jgi:transcriptional activator of cad operon